MPAKRLSMRRDAVNRLSEQVSASHTQVASQENPHKTKTPVTIAGYEGFPDIGAEGEIRTPTA